jgi:hypothetical protein
VATPEIRFRPSPILLGYLRVLARDTLLGATPKKVAETLLTIEVERRFLEGYHTKIVPTAEEGVAENDDD